MEEDMPQLTRRIPSWKIRGPHHPMSFKIGQRVIVADDLVYFSGFISRQPYNINYDEILRDVAWAVSVQLDEQEGIEAFRRTLITNKHAHDRLQICYKHGVWQGQLYMVGTGPTGIELTFKEV